MKVRLSPDDPFSLIWNCKQKKKIPENSIISA